MKLTITKSNGTKLIKDFNDADIGTVRNHVYKLHDNPVRKDTVGAFYALDDSLGG